MTDLEAITYDSSSKQIQMTCVGTPKGQLDSKSYPTPMYDGQNCWYGTGAPACYYYGTGWQLFCPCAIRKYCCFYYF